eukprot:768629-Hanusia_phi.AAC.6
MPVRAGLARHHVQDTACDRQAESGLGRPGIRVHAAPGPDCHHQPRAGMRCGIGCRMDGARTGGKGVQVDG